MTTSQSYNAFGELETEAASVGTLSAYGNTYTRDELGRTTRKVETIQGTTTTTDYGYDLAGRLDQVFVNGLLVRDYEYDPNGNRTSVDGGLTTVATYDDQDRLLTYGTKTYTFNAAGDLETVVDRALPPGQDTTHYVYDALGNLVQATLPDGTVIDYVIDGQNRRIGKRVNGTLERAWLYGDQLNPVVELDGSEAVVSRFVYATRPNVPDYLVRGGATYRILSDHLGTPRLVVDTATGTVAQRLDVDEFGQVTADSNPGFQPFGFAGGIYDADTGLVRFGARDVDPGVGRWTGRDPIWFAGGVANLYVYASNNAQNLVDPEGTRTSVAARQPRPGDAVPLVDGPFVTGSTSGAWSLSP